MFNLGFPEIVLLTTLLAVLIFGLVMLVDVVRHKGMSIGSKLVWIVAMLLLNPFVAMYYFFTRYRKPAGSSRNVSPASVN